MIRTRTAPTTLLLLLSLVASLSNGFAPLSMANRRRHTSLAASNADELMPLRPGATVALITPFTGTGAVDYAALERLLERHVAAGTDNLCILGTTGESATLSPEERAKVLRLAVDTVKGRMPILAGTGTINPAAVRDMTLQARDLGCDAALIVTPYYVKPPQRGLVRHYLAMAELGLPVVIYNVPGRTGVNMADESVLLASEHPNVVGLKDATGDLARLDSMVKLLGDRRKDFLLYSGDDSTTLDFVLRGGDGCISVTANVAPKQMHEMMVAALAGDAAKAKSINDKLSSLHKDLFCESNPMPTKWAAQKLGLINTAYCRPPLDVFDDVAFGSKITDALTQAGLV